MPASIAIDRVTAVLLDDGWHYIQPRSFHVEDYAITAEDEVVAPAQPGYWFQKIDQISREMQYFVGPIGEIRALRYAVPTEVETAADEQEEEEL